jgi:sugar phosphate isomerase/epimerase
MCADFDNVICVSKLANLASHVHAKDMKKIDFYDECSKEGLFRTRARNYLKGTYVGGGDAKVEQCIDILKAAGFDGYVDIEYEGQEDCIEGITKGYEFLKSIV